MLSNNSYRKIPQFFDENLKLVTHCPLCDNHFNLLEAKVLEEGDGGSLIYIKCSRCHSSILAVILNSPLGVSSVGLVTDLTPEEVMKFRTAEEVTENNVLDIYQLLQKTDSVLGLIN